MRCGAPARTRRSPQPQRRRDAQLDRPELARPAASRGAAVYVSSARPAGAIRARCGKPVARSRARDDGRTRAPRCREAAREFSSAMPTARPRSARETAGITLRVASGVAREAHERGVQREQRAGAAAAGEPRRHQARLEGRGERRAQPSASASQSAMREGVITRAAPALFEHGLDHSVGAARLELGLGREQRRGGAAPDAPCSSRRRA